MRIVLTGGGTGGHIYPAISTGQALRRAAGVELLFVGSSHGPEGRLAAEAGLEFRAVPSSPLTKSLTPSNAASLARLFAGVPRAARLLREFRPDAVLGTGGYTTAAVLVAARVTGLPVVIHEQNAVPGRTNRWLARLSARVCVSMEGTAAFFPPKKVELTGMPVREEFASLPEKRLARRSLALSEESFTILVIGGSQGARRINELVVDSLQLLTADGAQVLHQVGERNVADVERRLESVHGHAAAKMAYSARGYVSAPEAMAAADLVISRCGASTIAEITCAGLPAVVFPYPFAYADHQRHNAAWLVGKGAAVLADDDTTTAQMLAVMVDTLRGTPERLKTMADASAALARPNAAQEVADVVLEIARSRRKT